MKKYWKEAHKISISNISVVSSELYDRGDDKLANMLEEVNTILRGEAIITKINTDGQEEFLQLTRKED